MLKFKDIDQKQLVYRIISRTEELHRQLKNREVRRESKSYAALKEVITAIKLTKPEQLEYRLSRKAVRGIQDQLLAVVHTLTTSTIPTYMQRIDRLKTSNDLEPIEKDRKQGEIERYLTANKERVRVLKEVLRQIEEAL